MTNTVLANLYVNSVLLEARSSAMKKEVIQKIENASEGKQVFQDVKKGALRFKPSAKENKLTGEDINRILTSAGFSEPKVIAPGAEDAKSGRFFTYKIEYQGEPWYIVFAGGLFGNLGLNREMELAKETEEALAEKKSTPLLDALAEAGAFDDDTPVKLIHLPGKAAKRSLSQNIENVGPEISDLTIETEKGNTIYLSLKAANGVTFSNNGLAGLFKQEGDKFVFDKSSRHMELITAFGVDPLMVCQYLEDYVSETYTGERLSITNAEVDSNKALNYIRSGFDYGYWYVKEKTKKDVFSVIDFTTKEKLESIVRDVKIINVKYPYYISDTKSCKGCDVTCEVSGERGTVTIVVQIRNASGGLVPNQCNLIITKNFN